MSYNVLVMNNQLKLGKNKFFSKKNRKRKRKLLLKQKNLFYRLVRLFLKRHKNEFILTLFLSFSLSVPMICFTILFADTDYDKEMRKPNQDYFKSFKNTKTDDCHYYIHNSL